MITFPNAKINLGLRVVRKRDDGFHDIETIFYPVKDLKDILEIIPAADGIFEFTSSGIPIPGDTDSNLCVKAYRRLAPLFDLPQVKIHLHKSIPPGSGLGGGSSDAAFALRLLNDLFSLNLSPDEMMVFARELGSDCAFFIRNVPVLATGKGDHFEPVSLDLDNFRIEIRLPGIHVGTAWAYARVTPAEPGHSLKELEALPISEWKEFLVNDFEVPVMQKYSRIRDLKDQLYREGALYAAMSGSGSAVFGIFAE